MEGIPLTLKDLVNPPPMMPWREFANWIRMSEDHDTVRGWMRKVSRHVMMNVALLTQKRLGQEWVE